jgi:hypothetical protein
VSSKIEHKITKFYLMKMKGVFSEFYSFIRSILEIIADSNKLDTSPIQLDSPEEKIADNQGDPSTIMDADTNENEWRPRNDVSITQANPSFLDYSSNIHNLLQ